MSSRNGQMKPTTDVLSVEEVRGFIHRNWTKPNSRIEITESDNKRTV